MASASWRVSLHEPSPAARYAFGTAVSKIRQETAAPYVVASRSPGHSDSGLRTGDDIEFTISYSSGVTQAQIRWLVLISHPRAMVGLNANWNLRF